MKKLENALKKLKTEKKLFLIVIIGILGIILIAASELIPRSADKPKTETTVKNEESSYAALLEERLTQIISQIDGVGKVQVLLTLESSAETIYAKDEKEEYINNENSTQRSYNGSYVLTNDDTGVVLKTSEPKVRGVIIVCEGGDRAIVKKDITDAVTSALSVNSNNVSVLKMKIQEEQE